MSTRPKRPKTVALISLCALWPAIATAQDASVTVHVMSRSWAVTQVSQDPAVYRATRVMRDGHDLLLKVEHVVRQPQRQGITQLQTLLATKSGTLVQHAGHALQDLHIGTNTDVVQVHIHSLYF